MCLYDDGDHYGAVMLDSGERRARVAHKCDECCRVIDPGERYSFWTHVQYRQVGTQKMCAHCWGTIELGAALTGCDRYWFWDFLHDLDEERGFVGNCLDDGHDLSQPDRYRLLRTVIGSRRKWRRTNGDLFPIPAATDPTP